MAGHSLQLKVSFFSHKKPHPPVPVPWYSFTLLKREGGFADWVLGTSVRWKLSLSLHNFRNGLVVLEFNGQEAFTVLIPDSC